MSYNGSGTFVINSAGQPVVSGTVITSTAFNALTADLATGLSTAITKDGQSTPTANIGLGGFKITNLGAGTVASDAARLSQVQNSGTTTLISITGTDTITGTVSPTLTAYTAGQVFSFVVAATNTGAVTLNIDSIGAKAVTRTGAVALVAGDMVTGQVAIVEYDGTRFQLLNGNSFTNLKASGTLGVTGATTLSSTLGVTGATTLSSTLGVTGAATLSSTLGVTGVTTIAAGTALLPALTTTGDTNTGFWFPAADTVAWSTAGSERMRIGSTGLVSIGTTASTYKLYVQSSAVTGVSGFTYTPQVVTESNATGGIGMFTPTANQAIICHSTPLDQNSSTIHFDGTNRYMSFCTANDTERMRIDNSGRVLIGTTSSISGTNPTKLDILSDPYITTWRYTSAGAGKFWQWAIDSTNTLILWDNSITGVQIAAGGTSWSAYSDIRIKDVINPLVGGLSKIASLNPFIGKYKNDADDKRRVLLSAQEVLRVLPEAVDSNTPMNNIYEDYLEDGKLLSLRYTDLIPLLVAAIKDLKTITDAQAARITALETI